MDGLAYIDANVANSDLVGTLNDPTVDLTVFAPTNAAFGALAADLGFAGDPADTVAVTAFLVGNIPAALLNDVVLYHVLPASFSAAEIANAANGELTTLLGTAIGAADLPTLVDNEPDLLDPSLLATDILADNGVVHVIDRVLSPIDLPDNDAPTFADIIASDGFDTNPDDFDSLSLAATTAGLDVVRADATVDLTVFAPTDQAFLDLAAALGFAGVGEAEAFNYSVDALTLLSGGDPIPLLTDILLYHLAGESLQSSEVLVRGTVETLQGGTLTVDGTSLVDAEPVLADPSLVALDIQAANGVVHVIDAVLIPADLLPTDGANDVDFIIGSYSANDRIFTRDDADYVSGKAGDDLIATGAGNDVALGGVGFDRIFAGAGDDLVRGGSEGDLIIGQAGRDELDDQDGDDRIAGGAGDDLILGGNGIDRIAGGAGNDTIVGGADQDIMTGGDGYDTFVFGVHSGADIVTDFHLGEDLLDFSELDLELSDLQIKQDGRDTLVFVNETGDFVRLEDVQSQHLGADDFVL